MANLHAFVTNTISKCLKMPESFDFPRLLQNLQGSTYQETQQKNIRKWKTAMDCNIASRSLNRDRTVNKLQSSRASTNINISKHRQSSTWRKKMIVYKHCMQTAPQHEAGQCLAIASHSASRSPLAKGSPEQQPQKRKSRLNS